MRFSFFFIVYFFSFVSWSQNIKFKNYTTNQGLSNNSVIDIENDINGGLWIATWDGLNYFDGREFTVFKHKIEEKNSIAGNYIVNIEKDKEGTIWILTKEGKLSQYIGNGNFKNYDFKEAVNSLKTSINKNLLITTNSAVFEYVDGDFVVRESEVELPNNTTVFKNILLAKYPKLIINDVLKDKHGNVWLATRRNGLYIIPNRSNNIENTQIDHYTVDKYYNYSFNSNEIEKLHLDNFDNVWLGQKDGGLSMAYKGSELISQVSPHPIKYPHLPSETIRAISKDFQGHLWLGYYNRGIYYYNKETKCYIKYIVKEATQNTDWERVRTLFTASDGSLWVGTYAGLIRIDNNGYQLYEAKNIDELPNNRCYSIFEDEQKDLWIACWGGVAKYSLVKNKFQSFKGYQQLLNYNIRNVKKYNSELILSTENYGVVVFNLETTIQNKIDTRKGILGNSIYSTFYDEDSKNYWIASLGGVSIYNKTKGVIKNITEQNGLLSHMVYGLINQQDKVWLSTTKGLAVVDKNTFHVNVINPDEGWQAPEFSEGAYYKDPKGILYFGGVNGLNYFSPNAVNFKKYTPKIKLVVDGNENYVKQITKSHTQNNLTVTIESIVFPETKQQQFKTYYKLVGVDETWRLLKEDEYRVTYAGLPSGNYSFYVKTSSTDSLGKKYFSIIVKKAFYETVWFGVSALFLFAILLIFIFYIKEKKTKKQKAVLEKKIIERTQIIESQKEDLLRVNQKLDEKNKEINSQQEKLLELHSSLKNEDFELEKFKTFILSEFQEPITKIIQQTNKIKGDTVVQEKLLKNAVKLINLISEWNYLDHVKDIGTQKNSTLDLLPVLVDIMEKVKSSLQKNKVNFVTEIDTNIHWVEVDLLRFRLLLQYFFNDIVKYSNKQSSLRIEIRHQHDLFKLTLVSNSDLLINSWEKIYHFSPYFKSVKVLLNHLNGVLNIGENNGFKLEMLIPVKNVESNNNDSIKTISWKHLEQEKELNNNNYNVLIFSDKENIEITKHLLVDERSNLIFEDNVSDLSSALQQINIDVVVFYQTTFTKELVSFFNQHKQESKRNHIPFVYISEEINYTLNEQSLEFGIDVVIQLPASDSFVKKKIYTLLKPKKEIEENKLQKEIYEILSKENTQQTSNDKLLKKSLEVIKKELSNHNFNVEMLIDELGVSRVKCYRLFKEALKQSPSDVITSLRFQKAEYLLKYKNLNISEISFECGFNDPKYFGKSFKKQFGVSPKVYKEQNSIL